MAPLFQYRRLESDEIRVVTIVPAKADAKIELLIHHVDLKVPPAPIPPPNRLSLAELQKTLPKGFTVWETDRPDKRLLFEEDTTEETSWTHPDPSINEDLYRPLPENPPASFELRYEALSYTWGSSQDTYTVSLRYQDDCAADGAACHPRTVAKVGRNLFEALQHLRDPHKPRVLWIDALCINQTDTAERDSQVQRMPELYKMARQVVVWLGPQAQTPSSKLAMETLSYLGSQVEVHTSSWRARSPGATERDWFKRTCALPYDNTVWMAVVGLLERPWFERLWVWQEVALSNSHGVVMCGPDTMPWQLMRAAIRCLLVKRGFIPTALERRRRILMSMVLEGSNTVNSMLTWSRRRLCSNPRDKIYAILGMVDPAFRARIEPHYDQPVAAVYTSAFLAWVAHTCRVDMLTECDATDTDPQVSQLPSWVPAWSVPRTTVTLWTYQFASLYSETDAVCPEPLDGVLVASGVRAATVQHVFELIPKDTEAVREHLAQWEAALFKLFEPEDKDSSGISVRDAFLHVIQAGYLRGRWPTHPVPSLAVWRDKYQASSAPVSQTSTERQQDPDMAWCFEFIRGRRLFTTTDNHIGLGPSDTREGDTVAVLLGCRSPMLIRNSPSKAPATSHRIIGESYIHGFEDGQALLGPLPPDWCVQLGDDSSGIRAELYVNLRTGARSGEDPRLGILPLPLTWRLAEPACNSNDPRPRFRHVDSGRTTMADPRLLPGSLLERGVPLVKFRFC